MNSISFSKKIVNFNKDKIIKKAFCTKSTDVHEDFKTTRALIIETFRSCPRDTSCSKKIKDLKVNHLDTKGLKEHKGWTEDDMDLLSHLRYNCACKNDYPTVNKDLEEYRILHLKLKRENSSLMETVLGYSGLLFQEKNNFVHKLAEKPFRSYEDYIKLCREYEVVCEYLEVKKGEVREKLRQLQEAEPWLNIREERG